MSVLLLFLPGELSLLILLLLREYVGGLLVIDIIFPIPVVVLVPDTTVRNDEVQGRFTAFSHVGQDVLEQQAILASIQAGC